MLLFSGFGRAMNHLVPRPASGTTRPGCFYSNIKIKIELEIFPKYLLQIFKLDLQNAQFKIHFTNFDIPDRVGLSSRTMWQTRRIVSGKDWTCFFALHRLLGDPCFYIGGQFQRDWILSVIPFAFGSFGGVIFLGHCICSFEDIRFCLGRCIVSWSYLILH